MRDLLTILLPCTVSMSLVTLVYAAILPLLSKRYAAKWRYMGWLVLAAIWNDEQYVLNPSGPPSERYSALFSLENGDTKDLGSYTTKEECFEAVKAFCNKQVKEGKMTQQEADKVLGEFR